ncbi:putative homoserine kinase type II [Longilinea arvoryzae]|uniref:Putative homoserine kinase type II n=1 Tax=Longilinea arvoryzae TaxID=360412 RepID=A0A0S7B8X0_9CHLR|nr:phosphotransferase [Longilinea arvoryzae]GAP13710.1 putative homoserine kinase type II [Longilinea arvoryzae]
MDKHSRALFSDAILHEALQRFDGCPEEVVALDGFENFIYEIQVEKQPRILRIVHSLHRKPQMIAGEIDWINTLANHGVSVPRALPSTGGRLVEVIPAADGSVFSAVTFEKAPGRPPRREDWTDGLPATLGRMLGRMHALARDYRVPDPDIRRPEIFADLEGFARRYLPAGEETVIRKYDELLAYLHTLPTTPDVYGLIHQDAHGGNFFVQDGKITLFDFDDCLYGWYAYDIAMALFYVLPLHCTQKDWEFGRNFLAEFLSGYRLENSIEPFWLAQIPYFLKLREIDLYIAIHRSLDLNHLDAWCADFMRGRKENIENDAPYFASAQDFVALLP